MKTGHLNRPKTDEIVYPIHKKIIAIENSKNAPIYFIFRTFSNSDCGLMIFKVNISCYILLINSPLTLENTKFVAGELSLIVSLMLYLPTRHYEP